MKTLICAVLLLAAVAQAYDINENWPLYLKKCSKNDPNLEKCLLKSTNQALDSVFQGDPTLGIPVLNEYSLGNLFFGQNETYKSSMENAKVYGLKHLHVTGFKWNFDKKTVVIDFLFNNAIIISADYSTTGTFKGRDVSGAGKKDMIFVGGSNGANLTYTMNYELVKVLGRDYVQIKDRTCTHSAGCRVNIIKNKLKSTQQVVPLPKVSTSIQTALVSSNIVVMSGNSVETNMTIPVLNEFVGNLVDMTLNGVLYNFPLDIIFDSN